MPTTNQLKLAQQFLDRAIEPRIAERGQDYSWDGKVGPLQLNGDTLQATVNGTAPYQVEIEFSETIITSFCPCPYEGLCKHIAAVLYEFIDGGEPTNLQEETQSSDQTLSQLSREQLVEFLQPLLKDNEELRRHFLAYFQGSEEDNLSAFRRELDDFLESLQSGGHIPWNLHADFRPFENRADLFRKTGNLKTARGMYRILFEGIEGLAEIADDSDAYYSTNFSVYMDQYLSIVEESDLSQTEKQNIIADFFHSSQEESGYYQERYEEGLERLCESRQELLFWKELMQAPVFQETEILSREEEFSRGYRRRRDVKLYVRILKKLEDNQELETFLEQRAGDDIEFYLLYLNYFIENDQKAKALMLAEQGLTRFERKQSSGLRRLLMGLYDESQLEEHIDNYLELFLLDNDWHLFEKLKSISSKTRFAEIFAQLENTFREQGNDEFLVKLFIRANKPALAMEEIKRANRFYLLREHQATLGDLYPDVYFSAWKQHIEENTVEAGSRRHYRSIVESLRKMQSIKGFTRETNNFIQELRVINNNRSAFLDELSRL